jgi:CubicO group peptidase (beta-lactamase class C family)
MESGINATAADFARFGLLFLHGGERNGRRIVSEEWVRAATAPDTTTDPAAHYQYFWWVDVERPGRFYALGNLGQYIYVAPDAEAVIVRLGRDRGVDTPTWRATFQTSRISSRSDRDAHDQWLAARLYCLTDRGMKIARMTPTQMSV